MIEFVPVDRIQVNREMTPEPTGLDKLKEDLLANGLIVPLLLTPEFILVDGQRRLEAIKQLGLKEAICQVTEDFDVAVELLTAARSGRQEPLTPSRLYYQYIHIAEMGKLKMAGIRRNAPLIGSAREDSISFRPDYLRTLPNYTASTLQNVLSIFKYHEQMGDSPEKTELGRLIRQMEERGGTTRAYEYQRHLRKGAGPGLTASEQAQVLANAASSMRGMLAGLSHVGLLRPDVSRDEVRDWIKTSKKFVSKLRSLTNALERQLNNE